MSGNNVQVMCYPLLLSALPDFARSLQDMPAHKRRRVMAVADGFERHKSDGPKAAVQVPKFTSAFDEKQPQPARHKPLSKPRLDPKSDFAISKPVSTTSINNSKPQSLKQLPVPAFPMHTTDKEKKSAPSIRLQPPPDPRTLIKGETPSAMPPQLLQRPLPPPPAVPKVALPRPDVTLKNLPVPTIFAPAEASIDASMRTISTTEIALATDLLTDSGTAELAHIFLLDQHPDIAIANKTVHPEWNIGMSPQKDAKYIKGKGKEHRFVKCGLAARSSELSAQSRTSLVLWQKEMELQLASSSASGLNSDLRLRIVKIIDLPAGSKSGSPRKSSSHSSAVSMGIALCRIVTTTASHSHLLDTVPQTREKQSHLVVLSFPTIAPPRLRGQDGIYVRNPEDFIVGREICVWEPWHEVSLSLTHSSVPSDDLTVPKSEPEHQFVELAAAPFPSIPSTYPRPLSLGATEDEFRTSDTVLLCSRFVIVP
ncbi:hypothetical protein C0995_011699 [Termitomyces sp. Mi166|nr:hypothetical protein C0995_011699 [Termitomyces sp. Mi166\